MFHKNCSCGFVEGLEACKTMDTGAMSVNATA